MAKALGSVLSTIVNPLRTLRDIESDYEMATRNFCSAVGSEVEFWTETQQSLMIEMRALTHNNP